MRQKIWTNKEAARLAELAAQGLSAPRIGQLLGRTAASVRGRAKQFGIRFVRTGGVFSEKRRAVNLGRKHSAETAFKRGSAVAAFYARKRAQNAERAAP